MKRTFLLAFAIAGCFTIIQSPDTIAQTSNNTKRTNKDHHKEHDFNDGKLSPFTEDQGFSQNQLSKEGISFTNDNENGRRVKITWKESEYDGSRRERGHEFKLDVTDDHEVWSGFMLNVPTKSGGVRFPENKKTIIWQMYCWDRRGCDNWTAHLSIENNKLMLDYRGACVTAKQKEVLGSVPRNKNTKIEIRMRSGSNNGLIDVWVNDSRKVDINNANLGFGSKRNNGSMRYAVMGVKMGMYCADTANYSNNEVRNLYYDNVGVIRDTSYSTSQKQIDPRY